MPQQLDLGDLTPEERDARLIGTQNQYGTDTRSYNRSANKREMDAQRKVVTEQYQHREIIIQLCNCRSFNEQPHSIKRHDELAGDWDWRTAAERGNIQRSKRWEK